jgi:hypothetical protein
LKQKTRLVVLGMSFGNRPHLSRRGPTSFERRFLKELEESLIFLVKTAFFFFEEFFQIDRTVRMDGTPHLHVSMTHVEKLAYMLVAVLLLPICPLASFGTIQGGLACSAVLEREIRRCFGSADDAAPEHDCCLIGVRVV